MTVHRFYVPPEQITQGSVRVRGEDAAQIRRVLRMEPGALLQVFDGSGRQVEARITQIGSDEVLAEPLRTTYPLTETPTPVLLLQALLKGEKLDWVVEKSTELGASTITLFPARRSVTQVREERTARKVQRWSRIAKEAAEQCGRVRVPEVKLFGSLAEALKAAEETPLWMADEALTHPASPEENEGSDEPVGNPGSLELGIRVLIGPEGGWTDDERRQVIASGARPFSLGPRILRAETAAVVALARWTAPPR